MIKSQLKVTITASDVLKTTNGAVQQIGYSFVKEDQRKAVAGIVGGTDVFAVLPTGYGIVSAVRACHWSLTSWRLSPRTLAEVQRLRSSSHR